MPRSSELIASLAAALAKAQAELVNPEKSLVATVRADGSGNDRAVIPLCPAIERSRHCTQDLGPARDRHRADHCHRPDRRYRQSHDRAGACFGEWIASDWPVCGISETATPHRMGAALTYARRYALFTLVGIAGEDDLDAPDLSTPTSQISGPQKPKKDGIDRLNGGQRNSAQRTAPAHDRRTSLNSTNPILGTEASAELRDRLLAELANFGTADEAAIWAHRNLRAKNDLTAADAQRIEEAFQARLATLPVGAGEPVQQTPTEELSRGPCPEETDSRPQSKVIDKSLLALSEPRRVRDRHHVKAVAKRPCLILRPATRRCPSPSLRAKPRTRAQGKR